MAYRNKTYVCFDGDNDIRYYRMMTAWNANQKSDFMFYDAHEINNALDTSMEESIKRKLRERFSNSKALVVLVGQKTKNLYKFVKWEMEVALRLDLPIIAVNLDGVRERTDLCPATIRNELAVHVPFQQKIIQYALDHWPEDHAARRRNGESGAFVYPESVYEQLGL